MTKAEDLLCRQPGVEPDLWFRKPGSPNSEVAKAICSRCPALEHCRKVGLEEGMPYGVWGGLDEKERRAIWAKTGGKPADFAQVIDGAINGLLQRRRDEQRNGLVAP